MTNLQVKALQPEKIYGQVVQTLCAVITIATLVWVLWYCRYGIDFTDEGMYLTWISNPYIYSVSVTQFGFIYHPLYVLFDGNIPALRQTNVLITYCLAWLLSYLVIGNIFSRLSLENIHRTIVSAAIATTPLIRLFKTPNYNSLALQALLIAAIGMLLAERKATAASISGWILIGVGGWLAFMAKPTTAAVLGVCILLYLLLSGKYSLRLLMASIATAIIFIVVSALLIDGSIQVFIDRLQGGIEGISLIGESRYFSELIRLDRLHLGHKAENLLIVGTLLVTLVIYFSQSQNRALTSLGTLSSVTFAIIGMAVIFEVITKPVDAGYFRGLMVWIIPFSSILSSLAISRMKGFTQITVQHWALGITFLVFPYVYAFGSANNYWGHGSIAAIFWIFTGLVFLYPIASGKKMSSILLPLGFATQLITILLIHAGNEAPYRQPEPLRLNDHHLEIGRPGSTLILSQSYGHYIRNAMDAAIQANFVEGTPMIDLTGHSPGLLYALGATSVGQAWTIGGYPGSDELAIAMLKKVTCGELAEAWILEEPGGPIKVSPTILSSHGADITTDFEVVGSLFTPKGAGGYQDIREQRLLKPTRSADSASIACLASRHRNQ